MAHRAFRVGVVTDRMDDARAQVVGGLESVLRPLGGVILVVVHHRRNRARGGLLQQLVRAGRLDAVVVLPLTSATTGRSRTEEILPLIGDLPVVTVGTRLDGLPVVETPEAVLAAELVDHLVRECERRRPVLVGSSTERGGSSRRNRALEHAALTRGVTLQTSDDLLSCTDQRSAQIAFEAWLTDAEDRPRSFDGVVCGSDEIARGVVTFLADRGFAVPEDVSVVSYGNTDVCWSGVPAITSIDEGLRQQGVAAGLHLIERLRGDVSTSTGVGAVRAGMLVVRGSSLHAGRDGAPAGPLPWGPDRPLNELVRERGVADEPRSRGEEGRAETWRRARRLELARGAMRRGDPEVTARLDRLSAQWRTLVEPGSASDETGSAETGLPDETEMLCELVDVVGSFPEPVWWRAWLEVVSARLADGEAAAKDPTARRLVESSVSLVVERALAEALDRRGRPAHLLSTQMLELEQSLVGCTDLVELDRVLGAFLPRLGVVRFFAGLFERPVRFDPDDGDTPVVVPAGTVGEVPLSTRLVLCHGLPTSATPPLPTTEDELWGAAPVFGAGSLLPRSLSGELDHDTLMIQPIFDDHEWFGFFAYEGSGQDRHVGETLRLALARVLEAKTRTETLRVRSAELARLVEARTSELNAANERLRLAALHDGLTGLPNRTAFDDHLRRAWRRMRRTGVPFAVLMCDVDFFKLYNDVYGHLEGDDALRRVATLLSTSAERPDDLVSRFGGEEFAAVLGDTDLQGARAVADRMVAAVREGRLPHRGRGLDAVVTVSIGVAACAGDIGALDLAPIDLVRAADQALYEAKAAGRDTVRVAQGPPVRAAAVHS